MREHEHPEWGRPDPAGAAPLAPFRSPGDFLVELLAWVTAFRTEEGEARVRADELFRARCRVSQGEVPPLLQAFEAWRLTDPERRLAGAALASLLAPEALGPDTHPTAAMAARLCDGGTGELASLLARGAPLDRLALVTLEGTGPFGERLLAADPRLAALARGERTLDPAVDGELVPQAAPARSAPALEEAIEAVRERSAPDDPVLALVCARALRPSVLEALAGRAPLLRVHALSGDDARRRVLREARLFGAVLVTSVSEIARALAPSGLPLLYLAEALPAWDEPRALGFAVDDRDGGLQLQPLGAGAGLSRPLPPPRERFDDLVLPDAVGWDVVEVIEHIRRRTPDTGVIAFLSGASGTGKSMAAGLIAQAVGLPSRGLDLARLVSLWSAETARALDAELAAAAEDGVVLVLDHADAVFSRRDGLDARVLAGALDGFRGVALLLAEETRLDAGWTRRSTVQVRFPLPGEAERETLWRGFLDGAPLDPAELARRYPLSGGHLRRLCERARSIAAARGEPLSMKTVELAAERSK